MSEPTPPPAEPADHGDIPGDVIQKALDDARAEQDKQS